VSRANEILRLPGGRRCPVPQPAFGQKAPNSNPPTGFQPTPQFINGKVVLDDGTPPPDLVVIERICRGTLHTSPGLIACHSNLPHGIPFTRH